MTRQPKNTLELEHGGDLTDDSYEVARIWVTNGGGANVWIAAYLMEGAENFGHLMADTIRHGARAYASTYGIDENEALQAIVNGVANELREQFADIETIQGGSLN